MDLDISELLKRKVDVQPFEITYNGNFIEREDFKLILKSPLKVCGNATYDGQIANLEGNISAVIQAQCSRCLEPVDYPLRVDFEEGFSKSEHIEDVYPIIEGKVDLKDMVVDNLILTVPIKFLCSEDCSGLCPVCGTNLNRHQCNCNKDIIDPRLSVLKDLFKGD